MAFIVFEGLDGAGKSTLMKSLQSEIENSGNKVLMTREPGGTELGEKLRDLLLSTKSEAPTALAELLLYEAIRAQHVELKIQPALNNQEWVLCDRFTASSIAFQAGGRGVDVALIDSLNKIATQNLKPDLWVLLDLTTEEAQRRMEGRELDRFEKEDAEFHERVRQSYLQIAKTSSDSEKGEWIILDAQLSPEELHKVLVAKLKMMGLLS